MVQRCKFSIELKNFPPDLSGEPYSRLESFRRGAKKGVKIVIGTVPVFVMAGFIEGFVTRHTELPDLLRLGFILLSLSFIIFYYIYLPNRKKHGITET